MSRNTLPSLLDDLDTPPPTTVQQAALCILLRPRIEQLAADVWALAQKSPGLAADPALVALAASQLADLRRMLRDEPGVHLLPQGFSPGIALHALALGLRAMQRALALYLARRRPAAKDEAPSADFATLTALFYELTRDQLLRLAENVGTVLPPALRRSQPQEDAEAAPAPAAAPPPPGEATRRSATRRRARAAALPAPAGKPQPDQPLAQSNPRHLSWL